MLSLLGRGTTLCDGITRREVLRVGGLTCAGLTLADVLRGRAQAETNEKAATRDRSSRRNKAVILVWLRGGASHIDSYDMKPAAPPEIRGEFSPIQTNVPGIELCEYLPLHAQMMDKLAIIRGIKSNDLGDHTPHYILTGSGDRGKRPAFGSIVSALHRGPRHLPTYVSLMYEPPGLYDNESPLYVGPSHRPFAPRDEGLDNLSLVREVPRARLDDRRQLLQSLDQLRRDSDSREAMAGMDGFTQQALELITSTRARDAFNLKQEPQENRERYGKYCENFLIARRLVEAGVSVVTLKVGDWDTHEHNFRDMRDQLPQLDRGVHALVHDLYDRGLEQDVAVVVWGEFGRAPRVSRIAGRDHWPEAGAALIAGGGFRMGQVIGETEADAGRSKGNPYTPGNVLATMYRHLGIDPSQTIPDYQQRPMYLLEERDYVRELL